MRKFLLTAVWVCQALVLFAQIPAGYYNEAEGKSGYTLKTALHNIIKGHTDQGYGALWTLYETSDVRADGKVWEMYSDCDFTFGTDQDSGSGGNVECDKFNREHSMPKSWFNDANPMHNDPFHVVPTDKKVNSIRGNFAFGEVTSATYTSLNGSKLGTNALSGYSGTVFEPVDEYKGDFARGYFYMATRYEDVISGWENNNANGDAMLDGSSDQVFETWALNMLIDWHELDPVSQKEIDRNEAIYDFQGNRNPFIDHPEYVSCIWENSCGSSPEITLNESITDFGVVSFGNASTPQSYTISGSSLSEDIVITAPTHFQVSLTDNDADYTQMLSLTPSSGTVGTTTVFVRFKPESEVNGSVSGTISNTSSGASSANIAVSGIEEDNTPILTVDQSVADFGVVAFGGESSIQSYSISGSNLTGDVSITASEHFEISLTNVDGDFTSNLSMSPTSGTLNSTTVFIRFKPASEVNDVINGSVTHATDGVSDIVFNVIGTEENNSPSIAINASLTDFGSVAFGEVSTSQSYTVSGTNLTSNVVVTASSGFEVSNTDTDAAFTSSMTLSQSGGELEPSTVFVRFKPDTDTNATFTGTLTHSTTGVQDVMVEVTGSEKPNELIVEFVIAEESIEPSLTHSVTVTANQVVSADINVKLLLSSTQNITYGNGGFTTNPSSSSGIAELIIVNGSAAGTLEYSFNEELINLNNQKSISHSILESGNYAIGEKGSYSLTIHPGEVDPNPVTGLDEQSNVDYRIVPNPVSESFVVSGLEQKTNVLIYNSLGKLFYDSWIGIGGEIDVRGWPRGIYTILIEVKKYSIRRRFIVNK